MATDKHELQMSEDFDSLVRRIQNTSDVLQQDARLVINRNVTTRAWLTGFYIVEYEQHGKDRAKYGDKLLKRLAEQLDDKSFSLASLKNYRQFYLYYPEIARPIADYLHHLVIEIIVKPVHIAGNTCCCFFLRYNKELRYRTAP